jgi:hypothetical protein
MVNPTTLAAFGPDAAVLACNSLATALHRHNRRKRRVGTGLWRNFIILLFNFQNMLHNVAR